MSRIVNSNLNGNENNKINKNGQKISQEQLYDMLISRELSWQAIIYDLIRTEQLDPWNIDIGILAEKYLERLQILQQEHVFFISSKVLLAAALLLKIKSEILHENIKAIDEILFDEKKVKYEEIVNNSIVDFVSGYEQYELLPKTPLPRNRKITLQELMTALERAMKTEHRRIKKEIIKNRANYDISLVLPKKKIDIREKIKELYQKIKSFFSKNKDKKLTFTELVGTDRDERIACFLPILHLD
ncbi:MAG: segregation/condensation protein A, partial [Candidatus Pacearchaeota archaeon]|nr:segregation/condensation protein A [Candidatus Pacearchaeota archaeon]